MATKAVDGWKVDKSSKLFRTTYRAARVIRGEATLRRYCGYKGDVVGEVKWKPDVLWDIIQSNTVHIRVVHPGDDPDFDQMIQDKFVDKANSAWVVSIPHLRANAIFEGPRQSVVLEKFANERVGAKAAKHDKEEIVEAIGPARRAGSTQSQPRRQHRL